MSTAGFLPYPVFEHGSSYRRALDYYNETRYTNGNCSKCATCATLYLPNRPHGGGFLDSPGYIIGYTETGVYTYPRGTSLAFDENKSLKREFVDKVRSIVDNTLLHGVALYHTELETTFLKHFITQVNLLREAYTFLCEKKCYFPEKMSSAKNNEVVLYIELTHPVETAYTNNGTKITHPHVWIKTMIKSYGPPHLKFEGTDDPNNFISSMVIEGKTLIDEYPDRKIYVKFYISTITDKILRCEIDLEK